jgi:hypothetical protein
VAGLKISVFGGMIPAVDDRLMPDNAAAWSENTWVYSGRLSGIPQKTLVKELTAGTTKVFRIPNSLPDADHIDDSLWLEFSNADTDVVRALVVSDEYGRYYWASSTEAPKYNTISRIEAGSDPRLLGIPQPVLTSVTPSGGVGAADSRAYVTTWESFYGEEGPASTPVLATGKVDDTWVLALAAADADDLDGTNRLLSYTNIYRTVTSGSGVTTYFHVARIQVGHSTYNDDDSDAVVSANNELESTNWIAPPTDLQGMVAMPNGILAGWRENEVWFSEPYRPHAWPAAYTIVVDFPIVGLGVTNQTLVVCTQGFPVGVSGVHPSSMAVSKSASLEPCLSRGSILSTTEGVFYSSPNGLVHAGAGSVQNITKNLIYKDEWKRLVSTTTLRAARLGTSYFAFGSSQEGVFDSLSFDPLSFSQESYEGSYQGILIDPTDQRVGFNLMSETTPVACVQNDIWSGELFLIQGTDPTYLYKIDIAQSNPVRRNYLWRSKIFQVNSMGNFGAMKIYWEAPAAAPDAEGDAPGTGDLEFPSLPDGTTYGVVRVYGDGVLRWTRELLTSGELMRMASGFKADFWQLEFETYVNILSVQVAGSAKELRNG